jgi:hypothetical protein
MTNKVQFIHIFKTGGTSIQAALNQPNDQEKRLMAQLAYYIIRGSPFWYKTTYLWAMENSKYDLIRNALNKLASHHEVPDVIDPNYSFTFVRNPYDRVVSMWSFIAPSAPFEEFVQTLDRIRKAEGSAHYGIVKLFRPQSDYVYDRSGNQRVKYVGRYENFDTDLKKILGNFGIKVKSIPHLNASRDKLGVKHYSEFYTDKAKDIVGRVYHEDLKNFGYKFEVSEGSNPSDYAIYLLYLLISLAILIAIILIYLITFRGN